MECTYRVRKDSITDSFNQMHTVYGIEAVDENSVTVSSISDLFLDLDIAVKTAELFNREKLSIEHFKDAVEDAVAEEYGIF